MNKSIFLLLALSSVAISSLSAQSSRRLIRSQPKLEDHSKWVMDQNLWKTPLKDFAKSHAKNRFKWLSSAKKGIRSPLAAPLFGQPSGEVVLRAKKNSGPISSAWISVYNRGDNRPISISDLNKRFDKLKGILTEKTGNKPTDQSKKGAVNLTSLLWKHNKTAFLLEKSTSNNTAEFIRLRLAPVASLRAPTQATTRQSLTRNLVREKDGTIWIDNIPMVDQGRKGYCACASAARIYQYYGLETTQHEIAQIAKATALTGTSMPIMVDALKKVTTKLDSRVLTLYEYPKGISETNPRNSKYMAGVRELNSDFNRYQQLAKKKGKGEITIHGEKGARINRNYVINISYVRQKADPDIFREVMMRKNHYKRFKSQIKRYIDQGIPVAWALQLGMFKETGIPQMSGGHMRLIIGYNEKSDQLIYTDSWGAGHEKKTMDMGNAYCMTSLLLALPPLH